MRKAELLGRVATPEPPRKVGDVPRSTVDAAASPAVATNLDGFDHPLIGSSRVSALSDPASTTNPVVRGVTILANGASAEAIAEAQRVIETMIHDEEMIRWCADQKVCFHIIPEGLRLTDLPDFAYLRGTMTFDGRRFEEVRGVHRSEPLPDGRRILAAPEENLVESSRRGGKYSIAVHELAHLFHAYGEATKKPWATRIAQLFQLTKAFSSDYSSKNEFEFFSVHTECIWGRTFTAFKDARALFAHAPALFGLLSEAYFGLSDTVAQRANFKVHHPAELLGAENEPKWMSMQAIQARLRSLGFVEEPPVTRGDVVDRTWRCSVDNGGEQVVTVRHVAPAARVALAVSLTSAQGGLAQTVGLGQDGSFYRGRVLPRDPVVSLGGCHLDTPGDDTLYAQNDPARGRFALGRSGAFVANLVEERGSLFASAADLERREDEAGLGPAQLDSALRAELAAQGLNVESLVFGPSQVGGLYYRAEVVDEKLRALGYRRVVSSRYGSAATAYEGPVPKPPAALGNGLQRLVFLHSPRFERSFSQMVSTTLGPTLMQRFSVSSGGRVEQQQPTALDPQQLPSWLLPAHRAEFLGAERAALRLLWDRVEGDAPPQLPQAVRELLEAPSERLSPRQWLSLVDLERALAELGATPVNGASIRPAPQRSPSQAWSAREPISARGEQRPAPATFVASLDGVEVRITVDRASASDERASCVTIEVLANGGQRLLRLHQDGAVDALGSPDAEPIPSAMKDAVVRLDLYSPAQRAEILTELDREGIRVEVNAGDGLSWTELDVAPPELLPSVVSIRLRGGLVQAARLQAVLDQEERSVWRPLTEAYESGDFATIETLLEGQTLDFGSAEGRALLTEILEQSLTGYQSMGDLLEQLLRHAPGFDANAPLDAAGRAPVQILLAAQPEDARNQTNAERWRVHCLSVLAAKGARADQLFEVNGEKVSALAAHVLSFVGNSEFDMGRQLARMGADPGTGAQGLSLIELCARQGNENVARFVLEQGVVTPEQLDRALALAREGRDGIMVGLLEGHLGARRYRR